jgi:DNA-binding winged helix-turn-helix (wHTH) protein/tetratricopeptide (TPR) repeat protein
MDLSGSRQSSLPPSFAAGEGRVFVFGAFEFDEERWELRDRGKVVEVPPKVMQTIALLLRNRARVVSTKELLSELWPSVSVTTASLTKAIRIARQVLGDDGDTQACIKTTRGRGYRFVASVVERPSAPEVGRMPPPPRVPSYSAPPSRVPIAPGDEPFVGRDAELAQLYASLDRALAGRPSFLLVGGDAGIGKTRLLEVFARGAEAGGARVVWGRSCEEGGAPELWPWIQILRTVLEIEGTLRDDLGEIARLIAGSSDADDVAPSGARTDAQRFRVFEAVASALCSLAKKGTLVLVLEDLHAADAASLSLTRFLAREIRDAGVVVLGTYRPADPGAPAGVSEPFKKLVRSLRVLTLRGLPEDATRALMQASLEEVPNAHVLERVQHVTEGNPLFVSEIARQFAAHNPRSDSDVEIPERIVEAIRARFDVMPSRSLEVLSMASVIGRQFELPVLKGVSGLATDELAQLLEPAVERGIVRQVKGSVAVCQFTHILLRDMLYDALAISARALLHLRTGEVLEAFGAPGVEPSPARLAHHFLRAALGASSEKAVRYSSAAGRQALHSFAFEEAARHFEHALESLRFGDGHESPSTDLLLSLGVAQRLLGDYASARTTLDRALTLARGLSDPVRFARVALDYASVLPESGDANQGLLALLREAATLLAASSAHPNDETEELRSLVDARLATCASFAGRRDEAEVLSRRALAIARSLGRPRVLAHALHARHWLLWRPGTARERLAIASEMVQLEREGAADLPSMEARLCEITDLLELGRADALSRALSRYGRVAEGLRDPSGLYNARVFQTMKAILAGHLAEAERLADEALPIGLRIHPDNARTFYGAHIWWIRAEQGRAGEVEAVFRQRVESQPSSSVLRAGLLRLYVEAGLLPEARQELDVLMRRQLTDLSDDWSLLPLLAHVAAASLALGDPDSAAIVRGLLAPYADCHVVLGPAILYLGPVVFYLGLASLALASFDDAIEQFEAAVDSSTKLSARPFVARAQMHLGEARERRGKAGDPKRAGQAAGASLALARELGMADVERRVSALHERL